MRIWWTGLFNNKVQKQYENKKNTAQAVSGAQNATSLNTCRTHYLIHVFAIIFLSHKVFNLGFTITDVFKVSCCLSEYSLITKNGIRSTVLQWLSSWLHLPTASGTSEAGVTQATKKTAHPLHALLKISKLFVTTEVSVMWLSGYYINFILSMCNHTLP